MLGLQACPAAQLQPSSSKGWCLIQYSSHRLSQLAELQYAFCKFMMFSLEVLLLHSPIHCLDHGQETESHSVDHSTSFHFHSGLQQTRHADSTSSDRACNVYKVCMCK